MATTTGKINTYNKSANANLKATMQLMGSPYQFMQHVDPPVPGVSNILGRKYVDNIIMDAPIVTIIPGKAKYLPGKSGSSKISWSNAMINATNGDFNEIKHLTADGNRVKLYDFQSDFMTYYGYVNVLCRSCAGFLQLDKSDFQINGVPLDGHPYSFLNYDWKNYRWNGTKYKSTASTWTGSLMNSLHSGLQKLLSDGSSQTKFEKGGGVSFSDSDAKKSRAEKDTQENTFRKQNYVQFYVDPDENISSDMTNSSSPSQLKQTLEGISGTMKDIAFMAGTGGVDTSSLGQLGDSAVNALQEALGGGQVNQNSGSLVSRLLSSGKSIIKGENIIMPDIWTSSEGSRNSFSFTVHLKAIYGNRISLYMDVIVPLMHLIALSYPVATSANTYASPFLVKVYKKGAYTCNLGIVSSITIEKSVSPTAYNVDGMCTEMDVRLDITDLYPDIALTPPNDPMLFLNNSSLVEFLATTCGLDLMDPQLNTKLNNLWNNSLNVVRDLPTTAFGRIGESIDKVINSFTGL